MIISKYVFIHIKGRNIKYYKNKGYNIEKGLNKVKIEDLPPNSMQPINVKCDNCGTEKTIRLQDYNKSYKNNSYFCNKCANINYKKTCIEKYGVDNVSKMNINITKIKETKKKKYGDKNYNNIHKIKETKKEKYNDQNYNNREKINKTNLDKYGHITPSKNKIIKEKIKQTNLDKYGCTCTLYNEIINKKKISTCIDKYGVDNPMKNEKIYSKQINNSLKRKRYKNTNLYYQSSYEYDFLEKYYVSLNITKSPSIKYVYKNKYTYYFPDYYIKELNLIIEIKSLYWYNKYLDKNKKKQIQCIKNGYNFLFILDKNYNHFNELVNNTFF